MTGVVSPNGTGEPDEVYINGNNSQAADELAVGSGQSSPRGVQFDTTANGRLENEIHNTVDSPRVPERSMSSISISNSSKKSKIDPKPQECSDEDCAFGWTTYVLNHAWREAQTSEKRVSIHDLLHRQKDNPILRPYAKDTIRYAHLPANNMTWVEDLIKRHYYQHEKDNQLTLLRRDFWYGQQHGKSGPIHARFMRPRCEIVPMELETSTTKTTGHTDFVISMPYLHWETDSNREKMRRIIANVQEQGHGTLDAADIKAAAAKLPFSERGKRWWIAARKFANQRLDPDEKLLRKHLLGERPLHIRRTLDQSYYWTLKDTRMRDEDQVVYRATKSAAKDQKNPDITQVVMVDRLWLWILDGKLVISSFPRRWGRPGAARNKSDASGVFRTVRERLNAQPNLENVYDLATLLMDQCSRVFFDHTAPKDNRPEVMDIFANAIGDVTDRATRAWMEFWELITPNSERYRRTLNNNPFRIKAGQIIPIKDVEELKHQRLLDINPEGEILREIKDILDELHIMTKVYNEQHHVASEFASHINKIAHENKAITQKTKDQAKVLAKEIGRRQAVIHELTRAAERTAKELKELLDLKQKHANVFEARAGVKLAEQSAEQTKQGVRQAEESSKQNRSLMIFTIVTIIFLPLSFISSIFGMNAPEFGQGAFHIWKQFLIMFPVSIVIILFSLALALSEDILGICGTYIQVKWAKFLQKIGLFEKWKRKGERIKLAIERRKAELEELYPNERPVLVGSDNA